ncbi:hypothetical protein [Leucobacter sp. NPDC077196]|uniref:hypothetical protein n=1 Tax=Leucobacter sp. NPDC077196 TaxID=3154959 RepID=UPI00343BACA4
MATTNPENIEPDPANPLGLPQAVIDAEPTGHVFDTDGFESEDYVPGEDDDDPLAGPTGDDDA